MQSRRFTRMELMLVVVSVVLAALIILPFLPRRPTQHGHGRHCAGNLKQIGLSLLMYSCDYGGYFPNENPPGTTSFEPLISDRYIQNGIVWACPARKDMRTLGTNSSYRYIGSGLKDDNARATTNTLAYDMSGNHPHNEWLNVLFIDGHVEGGQPGTPTSGGACFFND